MARAMWKGRITFADVVVPVKLYAAVEDQKVHFRLLHAADGLPVEQRMVDPDQEEPVAPDDVRRGVEVDKGRFVVLDARELESVVPPPSRDIEVIRFVDRSLLGPEWVQRPYYLGPDGDPSLYFALVEALRREGKIGIARWVMRKHGQIGALMVQGDYLMLLRMRSAAEIVEVGKLEIPRGRRADRKEIELARQLVGALEDTFDPAAYTDEYRQRVQELVDAKASGKTLRLPRRSERPKTEDLGDALRRSLRAAKEKRVG